MSAARLAARVGVLVAYAAADACCAPPSRERPGPYTADELRFARLLQDPNENVRARSAEALGFMRSYGSEPVLLVALTDPSAWVRREAALALAWCGSTAAVDLLAEGLSDRDGLVRRNAWTALCNITAYAGETASLSSVAQRRRLAQEVRHACRGLRERGLPRRLSTVLTLRGERNLASGCEVKASTTYKGPPGVLTDGAPSGVYWQTKNVPFPQSCTVDLGQVQAIAQVVVHQYGPAFVMSSYSLSTSVDDATYGTVTEDDKATPVELCITFPQRKARYVRITSRDSVRRLYPTTFFEIEVFARSRPEGDVLSTTAREQLRAVRALGALGGSAAAETLSRFLGSPENWPGSLYGTRRTVLRTALRALGRCGGESATETLERWLKHAEWARDAAEALGDTGEAVAVPLLSQAFALYAKGENGEKPRYIPRDDRTGFLDRDRVYETVYSLLLALSRLPLDSLEHTHALREIAPLLTANIPEDIDGMVLYERDAVHRLIAFLLEAVGLRQEACEAAFEALGRARRVPRPERSPSLPAVVRKPELDIPRLAVWLPTLCRDVADVPRLAALLDHPNGWVRLNAAKAMAFVGSPDAIPTLAHALSSARAEGSYGFSGRFLHEEFADPAPRVRESLVRGLGLLKAGEHAELLAAVLNQPEAVLEVRHAAAWALADLRNDVANAALAEAAARHPFHSVRMTARDALRFRGLQRDAPSWAADADLPPPSSVSRPGVMPTDVARAGATDAIVFIKGENALPNHFQNDRWRQTYVTTDTGPAYRPGRNLFVLAPARPKGDVRALTSFSDGYVADVEVSWDGARVLFSRREQEDPWWHVWEIAADGGGLRQLTRGPFHDVGPAYLPDDRIVFASSRIGLRDEYHGYACTALYTMNADGADICHLAINAGRDNEPAVLPDGRVAFSRLEVFYSRLKTELTVHAVAPDGRRDVVLYGPERREFWQRLDVGLRGQDYAAQTPLMHRVLRTTQPQGLADGRIVCSSQGGLVLLGPGRQREQLIPHDKARAFTTPFPMGESLLLCASTLKAEKKDVDLGIFLVDVDTGRLTLVYNDPATADYEARPLRPRPRPPLLWAEARQSSYTGRFICASVYETQEAEVRPRGRLVRVVEGIPVTGRHSTQTNKWEVWRNHGGMLARVLGTVPLAPDGSFHVRVPADRLLHFQVLDADRQVVGNQLTWIYVRPGETRGCVGCHESPDSAAPHRLGQPLAARSPPVSCLPDGQEFRYRAKVWQKGNLHPRADLRTRTVRAVNLFARE